MLALLAAALLAQPQPAPTPGPIAVVPSTRRTGADTLAGQVAQMVHSALEANDIAAVLDDKAASARLKSAGAPDSRTCAGARLCLTGLASRLGSSAVVIGIDAGKVMRTVAVHLEAVSADGAALAQADFSAPNDRWADDATPVIAHFAHELRDALTPKTPVAAVEPVPPNPVVGPGTGDRPLAAVTPPGGVNPLDRPPPPPLLVAPPPKAAKSYLLPAALAGAGVAAGGVGALFGLQARSSIDLAVQDEYQAKTRAHLAAASGSATVANVLFAVAGTAAIGAAVALFWPASTAAQPEPPRSAPAPSDSSWESAP